MNIGIDCRPLLRKSYGIGTYTRNLLQNLLAIDNKNHYFLFFDFPDIPNFDWLSPKSRCIYVPFPGSSKKAGGNFASPFWENVSLPFYLKRLKIDVYLGTNYRIPLTTSISAITVVHGMAPFALSGSREPWLFKKYFKEIMRLSVKRAKKIISVSSDAKHDLTKYLNVPSKKINYIPLACGDFFRKIKDKDLLLKAKNKYGLPEKFILFVGGLTARKNLTILLRSFAILKEEGIPYKLVLCGGERFGTEELMKEVKELKLEEEVVFTGMVPYDDTLAAIYSLADVYVLPSFHEAFNLTLMEAMACEVPIVASNIRAIADEVGDSVLLVDPQDINGWVESVKKVLADAILRERLIKLGLERLKLYSWEETARRTLSIIESIHA